MFLLLFLAAMVWAVWLMIAGVIAVVLLCVEMILVGLAHLNAYLDERSVS